MSIKYMNKYLSSYVIPLTWTEGNQEEQPNQDNEEDPPAHVDCLTN